MSHPSATTDEKSDPIPTVTLDRHTVSVEPLTDRLRELFPQAARGAVLALVERAVGQEYVWATDLDSFGNPVDVYAAAQRYAAEHDAVYLPPAGPYAVVERPIHRVDGAADGAADGGEQLLYRGTREATQELVALAYRRRPARYHPNGGTHRLVVPEVKR